jgi:hypothetical protein
MKAVAGFALLVILVTAAPAARAENFDFTFSTLASPAYSGGGLTPGTVTGELIGLSADGTSSPTDVLLFSNPDTIEDGDLFAQGWFFDNPAATSFTVSNGVVTAGDFTLYSATTNQELILGPNYNLLINYIFDEGTGNGAGLDGVTFTPADVPEPAGLAVFLAGAAFLMVLRWSAAKNRITMKAGQALPA